MFIFSSVTTLPTGLVVPLQVHLRVICEFYKEGATVPIFKTQLRSVYPGPPIYFTDFILGMVISYYHIRMGI